MYLLYLSIHITGGRVFRNVSSTLYEKTVLVTSLCIGQYIGDRRAVNPNRPILHQCNIELVRNSAFRHGFLRS